MSKPAKLSAAKCRVLSDLVIAMAQRKDPPDRRCDRGADQATIDMLRYILREAEAGRCTGIMFACLEPGLGGPKFGDMGCSGGFEQDLSRALVAASRLEHLIHRKLDLRMDKGNNE